MNSQEFGGIHPPYLFTADEKVEEWMGAQLWVERVKRAGLSTQPCRTPVFRITVEDDRFPILTFCGLKVHNPQTDLGKIQVNEFMNQFMGDYGVKGRAVSWHGTQVRPLSFSYHNTFGRN